jgi:6-phosphofructokinase 1
MGETLRGNALVAQSGGPTAVINASACGVIQECLRHEALITGVFGANNGILGVLQEDLFDLEAEAAETIEGLRSTPSAAIGSCRHKLRTLDKDAAGYQRVLDVFRAHNVRYFFYIGGNDSMDTADKINCLAADQNYDLRVMGVPKTIDNDLDHTDHCPGFGSVAKYLATATMEAGRDTEAMHTFDQVTLMEAMGRNTGWIAAATGLARRCPRDAPHLIYVPEIPFVIDRFVEEVRTAVKELGGICVTVSEGLVDESGNYLTSDRGLFSTDSFGHRQLGGVADCLKGVLEKEVGVKCRTNKLGTCQREAIHFASRTDSEEAYRAGQAAVRQALAGQSGFMVSLVRDGNQPYHCSTGLARLVDVANSVKRLPRDYLDGCGTAITPAFREYAGPLVRGEVPVRIGVDGLPEFIRLERRPLPRLLAPFAEHQ